MKTGLVMEGGGLRGIYTAGVIDVFMEEGIRFDGAIGVSAGACFGCNIKSGQPGRAIRYNKRFCRDRRYCSVSSLIRSGDLFNAKFCYDTIPHELDPFDSTAFKNDPMEFYVTCTDIVTGEAVNHRIDEGDQTDFEWIRASASLPIVSNIVEIDGRKLLDGGLADAIPIEAMRALGYEKNIVIVTRPRGYVKKPEPALPLIRILYRDYPALIEVMKNRPIQYNHSLKVLSELEKTGEDRRSPYNGSK